MNNTNPIQDEGQRLDDLLEITPLEAIKRRDTLTNDELSTIEQRKRDILITKLLTLYISNYEQKTKWGFWYRLAILLPCLAIILGAAYKVWGLTNQELLIDGVISENIVSVLTVCVSCVSLVVSILVIITQYFFPKNDEKYITDIVTAIQKNDLDNKVAIATYRNNSQK